MGGGSDTLGSAIGSTDTLGPAIGPSDTFCTTAGASESSEMTLDESSIGEDLGLDLLLTLDTRFCFKEREWVM